MRKYLSAAIAVSVLVLVAPAAQARTTSAHTATPHAAVHVLTIGKLRGKPVAPKAKLTAGLAKGTKASFKISGQSLVCKVVRFIKKVVLNPTRPGTATLVNTGLTFAKCTISIAGVKLGKIQVLGLPFSVSASDTKRDLVTVSGQNTKSPITLTAPASFGTTKFSCSYSAQSISGHFSNRTHLVTFVKQQFTKSAGAGVCPAGPALFSAKFGPIRDVSVRGSPIIYVN